MNAVRFRRVSSKSPCPVCGKPDWCLVSQDGSAVICPRTSQGSFRDLGEAGFLHSQTPDLPTFPANWRPPSCRRPTQPLRDWSTFVRDCLPAATDRLPFLARSLGVSEGTLRRLEVGFFPDEACWLFPERDAAGQVIGAMRRYQDGSKRRMAGSQSGLTYALDWDTGDGPLCLVEGASDTAALMTLGLSVIGRPSNRGGVSLLSSLLSAVPADRAIVVIGERDQKSDGNWPGRDGAIATAQSLMKALGRPVSWTLPPEHAKDAREWLQSMPGSDSLEALRQRFLSGLLIEQFSPIVAVDRSPAVEPTVTIEQWRSEMLRRRLESLGRPGIYLDRSRTGTGKSTVDLAAIQALWQEASS